MNTQGPIVILEDDNDDIDVYQDIFNELNLKNQIKAFTESEEMFEYVGNKDVSPFLLISDINMPKTDGFEVATIIRDDPFIKSKCIPFILITTDASRATIQKAYSLSVQGIFKKPNSYSNWKVMMKSIVDYWDNCLSADMSETS